MVETVCGKIERTSLGVTSAHEHVFIDMKMCVEADDDRRASFFEKMSARKRYEVFSDPYAVWDNALMDEFDVAVNELRLFKELGGSSVIDCTLDEIGRDARKLKEVSLRSGVNIVMGTGHYYDRAHFAWVKERSVQELAEEMINDITVGVKDSGIRAGIIGEIGTSAVITENESKVLHAAGIAGAVTGKAIHVHTDLYTENGFAITDILTSEGVEREKICIDHVDVLLRPDYLFGLLDRGVYIEFDNFGKEFYMNGKHRFAYDLERVRMLKKLIDGGYEKQILMSNDICLKSMLVEYGGTGYGHILKGVREMFGGEGLDEKTYLRILTENVADFID